MKIITQSIKTEEIDLTRSIKIDTLYLANILLSEEGESTVVFTCLYGGNNILSFGLNMLIDTQDNQYLEDLQPCINNSAISRLADNLSSQNQYTLIDTFTQIKQKDILVYRCITNRGVLEFNKRDFIKIFVVINKLDNHEYFDNDCDTFNLYIDRNHGDMKTIYYSITTCHINKIYIPRRGNNVVIVNIIAGDISIYISFRITRKCIRKALKSNSNLIIITKDFDEISNIATQDYGSYVSSDKVDISYSINKYPIAKIACIMANNNNELAALEYLPTDADHFVELINKNLGLL